MALEGQAVTWGEMALIVGGLLVAAWLFVVWACLRASSLAGRND